MSSPNWEIRNFPNWEMRNALNGEMKKFANRKMRNFLNGKHKNVSTFPQMLKFPRDRRLRKSQLFPGLSFSRPAQDLNYLASYAFKNVWLVSRLAGCFEANWALLSADRVASAKPETDQLKCRGDAAINIGTGLSCTRRQFTVCLSELVKHKL